MSVIVNKRPESARMDYRGTIEYLDEHGHKVSLSWSALHANTVDALHAMHRYAQTEHKPHLKPSQYRIRDLSINYKDEDGTRRARVEHVPVPPGPNEAIVKRHKADPHPDFPFVDDRLLSQSQRAREAASAEPSMIPQ